jgi:hypothetical protein
MMHVVGRRCDITGGTNKLAVKASIGIVASIVIIVLGFVAVRGWGSYTVEYVAEEEALYVTNTRTGKRAGPIPVKSPPAKRVYTLTSQPSDGEYNVVSHDTTVLPGRFVIDLGGEHLDVGFMGRVRRGKELYDWQ